MCKVKTCFTGQHGDLLDKDNLQNVDYNLEMHKEKIHELSSNRLNNITCNIMKHSHIFKGIDRVLVQGDTTTALAIALSAFNHGIAVVHLEAGLRSFDMANPYPEEMNRVIISRIADTHLCPTLSNKRNLLDEGVKEDAIFVVGNTGLDNIDAAGCEYGNKVLLTMHRRENLDDIPLWFAAFEELAALHPELEFMIPLHPNPLVQKHAHLLRLVKKCEPMTHAQTIGYLRACMMVISDSGGLQEECSFLKKKVVVCRKTTERPETLGSTSFLCGEATGLVRMAQEVINDYAVSAEHQVGTYEMISLFDFLFSRCIYFAYSL